MSQFDIKMTELADKIKSKNTSVTGKLSVQGMIEAVNGITIGGGAGDSTVKFGYWTAEGKFQEVDLSGDSPVDNGSPITVDAVTFDTGKPTPDYGGGDGGGIDFYECTSYTPNFAGGLEYSMTLTGSSDPLADGTYIRTKWVDPAPEEYTEEPIAIWKNENGYRIEEYFYSEFNYSLYNSSGDGVYYSNMPYWDRVTDYSQIMWYDQINENDEAYLTFSPWQTSELPPTVESWSGYKMRQDSATFAWLRTEEFASSMAVQFLKPKVGEIFSADTSIAIKRMFNGGAVPIPEDGLCFYAPMEYDSIDTISSTQGTESNISFTENEGKNCAYFNGSNCKWDTSGMSMPNGSMAFSFTVMFFCPDSQSDWVFIMGASPQNNRAKGASIQMRSNDICCNVNGSDLETGTEVQINQWHTATLTGKNNTIKLYLDGKQVQSFSSSFDNSLDFIYLGEDLGQSSRHSINAYMAHAAVYNRELSEDEVAEIHNTLMEDVE